MSGMALITEKDLKEIGFLADSILGRNDGEFISEFAYDIEEDAKSILAIVRQYINE